MKDRQMEPHGRSPWYLHLFGEIRRSIPSCAQGFGGLSFSHSSTAKSRGLLRRRIKTMVALFACVIGSILASGCATNQAGLSLSDKKVCVIDLKSEPGRQVLLEGEPQTFGMRSGRVYLQPGESIGQHNTKGNEELLVFLSGKGVALIGEEESVFEVGQGKVCYIPPNTIHNIKNSGAAPLIYIYCVAPAR